MKKETDFNLSGSTGVNNMDTLILKVSPESSHQIKKQQIFVVTEEKQSVTLSQFDTLCSNILKERSEASNHEVL